MIHPCDGQTDRRTDGRAIAYTRYSIYAVARKNRSIYTLKFNFQLVFRIKSYLERKFSRMYQYVLIANRLMIRYLNSIQQLHFMAQLGTGKLSKSFSCIKIGYVYMVSH